MVSHDNLFKYWRHTEHKTFSNIQLNIQDTNTYVYVLVVILELVQRGLRKLELRQDYGCPRYTLKKHWPSTTRHFIGVIPSRENLRQWLCLSTARVQNRWDQNIYGTKIRAFFPSYGVKRRRVWVCVLKQSKPIDGASMWGNAQCTPPPSLLGINMRRIRSSPLSLGAESLMTWRRISLCSLNFGPIQTFERYGVIEMLSSVKPLDIGNLDWDEFYLSCVQQGVNEMSPSLFKSEFVLKDYQRKVPREFIAIWGQKIS